jgi:hypothetical protein
VDDAAMLIWKSPLAGVASDDAADRDMINPRTMKKCRRSWSWVRGIHLRR